MWRCRDLRASVTPGRRSTEASRSVGLSDRPYVGEKLQAKLIGRVVGFARSPIGNQLAAASDYDDDRRTI